MLLSHKYKFIFIKTEKTAGTSIEVELARFLGPRDVVTAIRPPVEGHAPRNHRNRNPVRRLLKQNYFNHMPARRVREIAGARVFDSYYKFCVEREPVSKCISMYSMITNSPDFNRGREAMSWDEYVERGDFPENARTYMDDDDSLLVDRILKFEDLNTELASICAQFGIPLERVDAKAKTGFRTKVEVTDKHRQVIYDAFGRSLKHTGYSL
jgi:hypothetical protein